MTGSLAQDAISLLIDLANRGEIDPWDVQVIDVIDRYLSELIPVGDTAQLQREATLSQSGQAFLYASMLVLLKADSLARSETLFGEPNSSEEGELLEEMEVTDPRMPMHLERQLRRRAVAPAATKRPVTLQELIDQLQLMSLEVETHSRPARHRHPSAQSRAKAVRAITELAQQENLSDTARDLEQFLEANWIEIAEGQDWLELELLIERWTWVTSQLPSPEGAKGEPAKKYDRVGVFWALLLLSAQSKVELAQDEFYQDLKIRALSDRASQESL